MIVQSCTLLKEPIARKLILKLKVNYSSKQQTHRVRNQPRKIINFATIQLDSNEDRNLANDLNVQKELSISTKYNNTSNLVRLKNLFRVL